MGSKRRSAPSKRNSKRRRRAPGLPLGGRHRFKRWAVTLGLGLFGYCALINGIVRHVGGGDVHSLSLRRMPEKTEAVAHLIAHFALHPFRSPEAHLPRSVEKAARLAHVDARLARAVARTESSFDPHAISATGAMGLMQLMPATADAYGVRDPFDADQNAGGGARLLKDLLRRYRGNRSRALAAYNAGPGRVPRTGPYTLPRETRAYVAKILR